MRRIQKHQKSPEGLIGGAILHALIRLRHEGDRLTGGGLRSLFGRRFAKSIRGAMSQPILRVLGVSVLKTGRIFSAPFRRLDSTPNAETASEGPSTPAKVSPQGWEDSLVVRSFYKAAFGRVADEKALGIWTRELRAGISLDLFAERLAASREFRIRHGSSEEVDVNYLAALDGDRLWRLPELEGLARWLSTEKGGVMRAKILAALAGSERALAHLQTTNWRSHEDSLRLVRCLFQTAFGRGPTMEEHAAALQQFQAGLSPDEVARAVVLSEEFQKRHGSEECVTADYLTALYMQALGRKPEPESLAFWLEAGRTRAQALAAVAGSEEASQGVRRDLVNCLYQAAFGRLPGQIELANAVKHLASGVSLEEAARRLVSSPEFQKKRGLCRKLDVNYVTAVYLDGTGRAPGFESLSFWLEEGDRGATQTDLLVVVAASNEALEKLKGSVRESGAHHLGRFCLTDTISDADRAMISAHIAGLPACPLISVVVSIDARSEPMSRESIKSVIAQLYPRWQLCLAVNGISETLLAAVLGSSGIHDPRIKVKQCTVGEGAAAVTSNLALGLATGEFVAFLRAGDLLAEDALYQVALELGRNEATDIVYTDQDYIDCQGQRFDPWFKPEWDADLLLGGDYISDLAVYRRKLIENVGPLRAGFDGVEHYDLALRCTAGLAPFQIRHLPVVLCHRKGEPGGNGSREGSSNLPNLATLQRVVCDHLDSQGDTDAILKLATQGSMRMRVVWPIPQPAPLVSILVANRDRADLLASCAEGILNRTNYSNLELLVADNGSVEERALAPLDRLAGDRSRVRILRDSGPFCYPALMNAAARQSRGEVLILLHNDVEVVDSDWLRELVSLALRPDVGVVGANLLNANREVRDMITCLASDWRSDQSSRFSESTDYHVSEPAVVCTVGAVPGACLAIRRAVFFEVGGLDEVNLRGRFSDVDLCLRVGDYGYRVIYTPFAQVSHSRASRRALNQEASITSELRHMQEAWGSLLRCRNFCSAPSGFSLMDQSQNPFALRRQKPWLYLAEHISNLSRYNARINKPFCDPRKQ
jgi:O-antigen biosynthesis protein